MSSASVISIPHGPIEATQVIGGAAVAWLFQFHTVRLKRHSGRYARSYGRHFNSTRSD